MDALDAIHLDLVERVSAREGLYELEVDQLTSRTSGAVLGEMRMLGGSNIDKAVRIELELDDEDTPEWFCALYVFAPGNSLVPHLIFEWIGTEAGDNPEIQMIADLIPRIDLAVNLDYVDEVYGPLDSIHRDVQDIEGVTFHRAAPRRVIAFSPWYVPAAVPLDRAPDLGAIAEAYLDRWISLSSGGVYATVDPLASDPARLVQHDRFHRGSLFDAESTPFLQRLDRVLGLNAAAEVRVALRSQHVRAV